MGLGLDKYDKDDQIKERQPTEFKTTGQFQSDRITCNRDYSYEHQIIDDKRGFSPDMKECMSQQDVDDKIE